MGKNLIAVAALFLGGCSMSSGIKPNLDQIVDVPSKNKTSIFYHYVDPKLPSQAMAVVSGTFEWKDDCLYLVLDTGKYATPLFPELPKGLVKWDESTKTLNLDGHIFKMGDSIYTNGAYLPYYPNTVGGAEYERQGDKKCLMPSLVQVGTMSLKSK